MVSRKRRAVSASRLGAWLAAALAVGCGFSDTGTGSRTLQVNGSITYSPIGGRDQSVVHVELSKEGGPVNGAIVQLEDADTWEQFVVPSSGTVHDGVWQGWHRRVAWYIVAGDDRVVCRLEGPGRHTITSPANAETRASGSPLEVTWKTADGVRGDEVLLRLGAFSATLPRDDGHVHIAAPALESGPANLTVTRRTRLAPAGAVQPSMLTQAYEVGNAFLLD